MYEIPFNRGNIEVHVLGHVDGVIRVGSYWGLVEPCWGPHRGHAGRGDYRE